MASSGDFRSALAIRSHFDVFLSAATSRRVYLQDRPDAEPGRSDRGQLPLLARRPRPQQELQDSAQRLLSLRLAHQEHDQEVNDGISRNTSVFLCEFFSQTSRFKCEGNLLGPLIAKS